MAPVQESDLKQHEKRGPRAHRQIQLVRYALRKQNRLLVTLLFVNTTSNMALPMFLEVRVIAPPQCASGQLGSGAPFDRSSLAGWYQLIDLLLLA